MASQILEVIQHYQRAIERSPDEQRLLHCINKLYKLPVKVEHLQETGIGKTVNSLRKYNGEIGVAAKALVTKWKAMVAAEEEPMETNCQSAEEETNNGNGRHSSDDDQDGNNRSSSNNNNKERKIDQKSTEERNNTAKEKDKRGRREGESEGVEIGKESQHISRSTHHHEKSNSSSSNGHIHTSKPRSKESHQAVSEKPRESGEKEQKHHRSREEHSSAKDKAKERHQETNKPKEHQRGESGDKERETEKRKDMEKHKSRHSDSHRRDGSSSSKIKSENEHTSSSSHISSHNSKEKERNHERREHKHKDSDKQSGSSKEKHDERKSKETKQDREKTCSSKQASSLKDNERKSSSKPNPTAAQPERKRSHDENESNSPQACAKKAKTSKTAEQKHSDEDADDGIDSSMGANFADVLGMLNVPTKKSKKSLQASTFKSPTATPSSSKETSCKTKHYNTKTNSSSSSNSSNNSTLLTSSATKAASTFAASRSPNAKPELLSSSTKLEPLDPSIVLDLPAISTNYKPMPLNQTVMDCVFNNYNASGSSTSKAPVRMLTDAEAISHGISSKTKRTKIYSGVKTGQILQVPSLFDLCIRVLQKNIDALEYTGGVPFEVLRSVLERATPQQLLTFEDYNPYLMEDSDVLWQMHVQRNYRCQKRQEMESWREMYLRCQEEEERKLNILAENIKQSQKIISAPVRKTQLAFVDSLVKPPRNVQRKQEQYGTKSKLIATPAARVAALSSVTPNAAKLGDTRLRVPVAVRDHAHVSHTATRPKKAPLMAKTLQFMRGRHKR